MTPVDTLPYDDGDPAVVVGVPRFRVCLDCWEWTGDPEGCRDLRLCVGLIERSGRTIDTVTDPLGRL